MLYYISTGYLKQHWLPVGYRWLQSAIYALGWLQKLQMTTEIAPWLQRIRFFLMKLAEAEYLSAGAILGRLPSNLGIEHFKGVVRSHREDQISAK
jgi:hypothetical protein